MEAAHLHRSPLSSFCHLVIFFHPFVTISVTFVIIAVITIVTISIGHHCHICSPFCHLSGDHIVIIAVIANVTIVIMIAIVITIIVTLVPL